MLDSFNLPDNNSYRTWIFKNNSVALANTNGISYQTWTKPSGINFIQIIGVSAGGGGGGGGGYVNTSTAILGGGGGASATMTSVFLPAFLVPDILYIQVGRGGVGGNGGVNPTSGTNGLAGGYSAVAIQPVYTVGNNSYYLMFAPGGNGGTGGGPSGGGGNNASTTTSTTLPLSQMGLRNYWAGQNSTAGGTNVGSAITAVYRISSAPGGVGHSSTNVDAAGVAVNPSGDLYYSIINGGTIQGGAGNNGLSDFNKMTFSGGAPGGSASGSNGGLAGFGGYGCGGAGGSVGNPSGSNGGNGGDGFVIITCG
jgi:hypothetical protein